MSDELDPPRKIYGLKARGDFKRVNLSAPADAGSDPADVHRLLKHAAADPRRAGVNSPGQRKTEVPTLLPSNLEHEQAAGRYRISFAPDPRRQRRVRTFWIALLVIDAPLGLIARKTSQAHPVPFAFAISGIALFTSILIWRTWSLRTGE